MKWAERRARFRALLSGQLCRYPASIFDPLSARIAEDIGFEAGMLAGSTAALTVLGAPDLILLTLSEFAGQALRISRASTLPFLVDADHGYGNALNVRRTIEELEIAGVAGITIEDTALPKAFGAKDETRLISIDEGVGKMRAALDARVDSSLVIVGRTTASVVTIAETVSRARAYEAAGVDVVFLTGVKGRTQLDEIAGLLRGPIILGGGGPEFADLAYLQSRNVRLALQGHQPIAAAVRAVYETLLALRGGADPRQLAVVDRELMERATRATDYRRWTDEFLT
jgi:carboxyvinyl-carboxyphosphonate phosphorylmutase